jgi:hypothetical protein
MSTNEVQVQAKPTGWLKRFTAVDLTTIALFAVLLRFAFLPVYKALYIVFPWNQALLPLFMAFCAAIVLAIVPKPGAILLWTIVWLAIDFFLQGEDLVYALGCLPIPFIVEGVFWLMKRWGADWVSLLVGTMVYTAGFKFWDWLSLNKIFLIPYPLGIFLIVSAVAILISNNVGAYLGFLLGKQLRRLVG